jgi:hypothetical protein
MWGLKPVPFAERDDWRNTYTPSGELAVWPQAGHYSLYGSSYVGFFGGIISRTSDEQILELNCLTTDFAHGKAFPTSLIYNPALSERSVTLDVGHEPVTLYDAVRHEFVARNAMGKWPLTLRPDSAVVLVRTPQHGRQERKNGRLLVDGVVVDFRSATD